ncbi:MAG: phage portal protein [Bacteroidia bacterium]
MSKVTTPNFIDRLISAISPEAGYRRIQYRKALSLLGRRYEGAANGRRTSGWVATSTSANAEIHTALTFLRNRSRDLVRNNGYAKKAVTEIANNLVGTGIVPTPILESKPQSKKLKAAFKAWADSTDCDYDGHLNYYGIQWLAALTMAESGEVLIRKHIVPDMEIPLQLQVLEPDFVDTTKYNDRTSDGGYIYYGVEFNAKNQVVAYWLWPNHPGDQLQYNLTSVRVPATELIHLFKKERPGQFRGVPFGHAAMLRLKDLDDFEDTQLIRQKIAACFTAFRRKTNVVPIPGVADSSNPDRLEKLEPGVIEDLAPGEDIAFASPPDAGANYDPYVKSVLRVIAAAYGIDYVTLTGDLTAVNFSSGRMGWLQFNRNITVLQWNTFIPTVCNKTWQWFMKMAFLKGVVKTEVVPAQWTTPKREMIDPTKEGEAQKAAVRAGFMSWQEVVRENGYNPEEVLQQHVQDRADFKNAGLIFECDPTIDIPPPPTTTKKAKQDPQDK